jgi:hypothetical protein
VVNLPPTYSDSGKTCDQVGQLLGVSGKTVEHAGRARKKPGRAERPGLSKALHKVENVTQQADAAYLPEIHSASWRIGL